MPILRRIANSSSLSSSCITFPMNLTPPCDGRNWPPKWRSKVDLPQPLEPMMPTILPRGMVRLIPFSTLREPYEKCRSLTSIRLSIVRYNARVSCRDCYMTENSNKQVLLPDDRDPGAVFRQTSSAYPARPLRFAHTKVKGSNMLKRAVIAL